MCARLKSPEGVGICPGGGELQIFAASAQIGGLEFISGLKGGPKMLKTRGGEGHSPKSVLPLPRGYSEKKLLMKQSKYEI